MKSIRLLWLLLLVNSVSYSQETKKLSLEIKNLEDNSGYCGNVYYVTEIGYSRCFQCKNGNVDIYFMPHRRVRLEHTFISFREDKSIVANINLPCLLFRNSEIRLSNYSVRVTNYSSVVFDDDTIDSVLWKLVPVPRIESKLLDYYSYPQEDLGYLPKKILRKFNDDNKFIANMFSLKLQCLGEPILCHRYPNDAYRFTWISSMYYYDYDPYSVRIEVQEDGSAILFCGCNKWNDRNGEIEQYVFPMKSQQLEHFMKRMDEIDLKGDTFADNIVNQNVSYILEANIDGHYHVIFRGEGEDPALDELQRFLWSLTGLGENKIVHRRMRIE